MGGSISSQSQWNTIGKGLNPSLRRRVAAGEEVKPETATAEKKGHSSALWLLIVLALGVSLGIVLSLLGQARPYGAGPPPQFAYMEPVLSLRVIFSTTSIVLLVALVIVYAKMFIETKANFSLGLVVMLSALMIHSIISYPLLVGRAGTIPTGPGVFLSAADVFMVAAYAIFLYLSLE